MNELNKINATFAQIIIVSSTVFDGVEAYISIHTVNTIATAVTCQPPHDLSL